MSEEIKNLSRARGSIKQRLTLFQTHINGLILASQRPDTARDEDSSADVIAQSNVIELRQRIEYTASLLSQFDEVHLKIELQVEEDELEAQYKHRQEFEQKFHNITAKAYALLDTLESRLRKKDQENDRESVRSEAHSGSTNHPNDMNSYANGLKLPTIEIPQFKGNYEKWLEFRDTFESLIHQHTWLRDIHKFHYLRASLLGEAKQVIKSLDFSEANYQKAWNSLCARYNNTRLLINNHIKALFDLETISAESSQALRIFCDTIEKHLCALQSLNEPTDHWDTPIIYMASLKLDNDTNRKWEEHQSDRDPPTLDQFMEFLHKRADFLESVELKRERVPVRVAPKGNPPDRKTSRSLVGESKQNGECPICQSDHAIYNCGEFQSLTVKDRVTRVKALRLCLNCLRAGHFMTKCKSKTSCRHCNARHNTLLHLSAIQHGNEQTSSNHLNIALAGYSTEKTVLLSTILVHIFDKHNKLHNARALLDAGSQSSYITSAFVEKIGIGTSPVNLTVSGINMSSSSVNSRCEVTIQSQRTAFSLRVTCLVIPKITGSLPEVTFNANILEIPKHLNLADPMFNKSQEIDVLLGADHFWSLLCAAQVNLGPDKPILQKTKFGWIVSGPVKILPSKTTRCNLSTELSQQVARFWEIEENQLFVKNYLTAEEDKCEQNFKETTRRDECGRFIVSIPLKGDLNSLGESRGRAVQMLKALERRFVNNPTLKSRYVEFMNEYQELGHMSLQPDVTAKPVYYMPHHGVIKEERETTKLRVVFNASAPTTTGCSLNDLQCVGPTIQENLLSILLRFRQHTYVVSADITKMYRQVMIQESQRHLQLILWRPEPDQPILTYALNTVTYGTAAASFLAIRCLWSLADQYQATYPNASCIIRRDFYVDDLLTGAEDIETLQDICKDVSFVLDKGGFHLRKWTTNEPSVIKSIDKSDWSRIAVCDLDGGNTKTLGIMWSPTTDRLLYKININQSVRISKRSILSEIARVFDPLGLLAPVIIVAKLILQSLWQLRLSWDESIPLDLHTRWMQFREELDELNQLSIDRHVVLPGASRVELHGFSDASLRGYGACIYIRSFQRSGQIFVRLLCAKARVSPLKPISLPRLELCGALILARLFAKTIDSLNLKLDKCVFWSDSTIVLSWIATEPAKLTNFVKNRIAEIRSLTENHEWRHVVTSKNPADVVSRGVSPAVLKNSVIWWHGPPFLSSHDDLPGRFLGDNITPACELETQQHCLHGVHDHSMAPFPVERFSELRRLRRTVALCRRFKFNCLNGPQQRMSGPLTHAEHKEAVNCLAKMVQGESFPDELSSLKRMGCVNTKSKMFHLAPFLHEDGTIRVGGRLKNASYGFDKLHPIILPPNHAFTRLIFKDEHAKLLHCGPQLLLSSIRENYWTINGKNVARNAVHECVICVKANPKSFTPFMGNLPESRITPSPPFTHTGLDYAGPILIASKRGRGAKLLKCWICVFICFATKSIHLEPVSELTTEAFLMTLRRFVARRGKPSHLYSDNGSNFIGANNELKELTLMLSENSDSLSDTMASEGTTWHFIPARSPHFGGIWEAGVRSFKYHFKRVAGNAHLTFEELQTLLTQLESILNSRPLSPLSSDPNDLLPLTPGHFLIGRPLVALPDVDLTDEKENRLTHYQRIQQLQQHFWVRWKQEYLAELQSRRKWAQSKVKIEVGQLVVLKDDSLPPLRWHMGRIVELHPGRDGHVRAASVKTSSGIVRRAIIKLCPLPAK